MKKANGIFLSALAVVVAIAGFWMWSISGADVEESPAREDVETVNARKSKPKTVRKEKRVLKNKPYTLKRDEKRPARTKPANVVQVDEEDEAVLNAEQKKVLADLQVALDANDLAAVRKVLARLELPDMKTGTGGEVPVCMRARAVEALGWFGKNAAIDLIGYLGDANDGVAQDALSQFELTLDDSAMSDLERSDLIVATMKAINDPDVIDQLLGQLNNMRNSVKAKTVSAIMTSGTAQAQQMMIEQSESYLDEGVKDVPSVEKWTAENPDDEDDAELYGGEKSSDD